jgi:hypothetical protein
MTEYAQDGLRREVKYEESHWQNSTEAQMVGGVIRTNTRDYKCEGRIRLVVY